MLHIGRRLSQTTRSESADPDMPRGPVPRDACDTEEHRSTAEGTAEAPLKRRRKAWRREPRSDVALLTLLQDVRLPSYRRSADMRRTWRRASEVKRSEKGSRQNKGQQTESQQHQRLPSSLLKRLFMSLLRYFCERRARSSASARAVLSALRKDWEIGKEESATLRAA